MTFLSDGKLNYDALLKQGLSRDQIDKAQRTIDLFNDKEFQEAIARTKESITEEITNSSILARRKREKLYFQLRSLTQIEERLRANALPVVQAKLKKSREGGFI